MNELAKLLPCPFCGNTDRVQLCNFFSEGWAVHCYACRSSGGMYKKSSLEAAVAWNNRQYAQPLAYYQIQVNAWVQACFGAEVGGSTVERNYRFIEEALELVQSCSCTKEDVLKLVDYVYSRPVGEINQELGGVLVTLTALCNARKIDMDEAAYGELKRCWAKIETIRQKQVTKQLIGNTPAALMVCPECRGSCGDSTGYNNCPVCDGEGSIPAHRTL